MVEMLIQISAKIGMKLNEKDDIGRTAFHWASCNGNEDAVETIIDHSELFGIDLLLKDNDGMTGFQLAQIHQHTEVINLINKKIPSIAVNI